MLSVTCSQCNARYTMSDELYHRKGGGQAVIVTCKRCKSEIRFDAGSAPSNGAQASPEKDALTADLGNGSDPGPFVALSSGFFGSSKASNSESPTPIESQHVAAPPQASEASKDDEEVLSVRATDLIEETETAPLAMPKKPPAVGTNTGRRLPAPPPRRQASAHDDESPPSSSGTPTLTTLMGESSISARPKPPTKRADDFLMSLTGTGTEIGLGPPTIDLSALTAPPVTPPESAAEPPASIPSSPPSAPPTSGQKKKKKKKKGGPRSLPPAAKSSLGATAAPVAKASATVAKEAPARGNGLVYGLLALVAIGFGAYLIRPKPAEPTPEARRPEQPTSEASPPTPAAPAPTAAAIEQAPAAAPANTLAAPTPSAAVSQAKPSGGEAKAGTEKAAAPAAQPAAEAKAADPPAEKPAAAPAETAAAPAAAAPAATAPAEAAPAAAEPAVAQHGPFKPDEAKAALAAAATQASACRKGDDPTGTATVIITFAPSGRVTSANVSGPPFAGTATGGCIAATMRKAKVSPFDGDKVTVSKVIAVQ